MWMISASISASRSPRCETAGIINKMLTALVAGGRGCISDDDAATAWAETALEYLRQLQDKGAVEGVECVQYEEQSA